MVVRTLQPRQTSNDNNEISKCCSCQRKLTYSYLRIRLRLTATGGHKFGRRGGKNPPSRVARRQRMSPFMEGLDNLKLFGVIPSMYNTAHNTIWVQDECKGHNKCLFGKSGDKSIYFGEEIQTIPRCTIKWVLLVLLDTRNYG